MTLNKFWLHMQESAQKSVYKDVLYVEVHDFSWLTAIQRRIRDLKTNNLRGSLSLATTPHGILAPEQPWQPANPPKMTQWQKDASWFHVRKAGTVKHLMIHLVGENHCCFFGLLWKILIGIVPLILPYLGHQQQPWKRSCPGPNLASMHISGTEKARWLILCKAWCTFPSSSKEY